MASTHHSTKKKKDYFHEREIIQSYKKRKDSFPFLFLLLLLAYFPKRKHKKCKSIYPASILLSFLSEILQVPVKIRRFFVLFYQYHHHQQEEREKKKEREREAKK